MTDAIEPPATDPLFGGQVGVVEGDFEREFWVEYAASVHKIDRAVLEARPTGWIVGRCREEPNRHYQRGVEQ